VITNSVQELFRSGNISEISATLDKVTVQHRSFTVLITFFFYDGALYSLLNELIIMKEEDYDARGTATFVTKSMKESLGLSRTQLATLLKHFRCTAGLLSTFLFTIFHSAINILRVTSDTYWIFFTNYPSLTWSYNRY
jgi:hypothetical protein